VSSGSGCRLPDRKGSGATTCTVAPDPASLQGRAPVHHMSYNSRSFLLRGEGSGASRVQWLRILPPCREGCGAATACPAISYGPRASSIEKRLTCLPVQLDTHVSNARAHVP
jgi:hypothetical protein